MAEHSAPSPVLRAREYVATKAELYDARLEDYSSFTELEKITGFPKLYIATGILVAFIAVSWIGLGANICAQMIALLYPGYRSFKVIERFGQLAQLHDRDEEAERVCLEKVTKYLMYWVVYGCFNVVEVISDLFLFFVPFYWPLKMAFLLWCVHPESHGSVWVYKRIVAPILTHHETIIDRHLSRLSQVGQTTMEEIQVDAGRIVRKNQRRISNAAFSMMAKTYAYGAEVEQLPEMRLEEIQDGVDESEIVH